MIRKTPMKRTSSRKRTKDEGGDEDYLDWIRSLDCCMCGAKGPSHPHHSTGAGMGLKSSDREAMPLCWRCHRHFHDNTGPFDGWHRAARRVWQELQVERCLSIFAATH